MGSLRFRSITITEGESDLWIGWNRGEGTLLVEPSPAELLEEAELRRESETLLRRFRFAIQEYGGAHPDFLTSLDPLPLDSTAAEPVPGMLMSALAAGVGPMAAVAGAIAEALGMALREHFQFDELVIENGGDYWISVKRPLPVLVYGGLSSLSGKVSVLVPPELSPCGLACSSGTVGPSLSFGKADAALVLSPKASAADTWATALGNQLRYRSDLAPAVEALINTVLPPLDGGPAPGYPELYRPLGALALMADRLAACGKIQLGS